MDVKFSVRQFTAYICYAYMLHIALVEVSANMTSCGRPTASSLLMHLLNLTFSQSFRSFRIERHTILFTCGMSSSHLRFLFLLIQFLVEP